MTDQYIGTTKIAEEMDVKDGLVTVTLLEPQGVPPTMTFTVEQLGAVLSLTPYPDGDISIRKWKLGVAKLVGVLLAENMEMVDFSFVMGRLRDHVMRSYDNAVAKKFGVDNQERISLQTIDEVLRS